MKGRDFVGVFLGEFVMFSKKEPILPLKIPPFSLLLFPVDGWVRLDELGGVREETPLKSRGAQFLAGEASSANSNGL